MSNDPPPIQFALVDDLAIAYQVLGSGPVDLIFDPPITNHLEILWEHPSVARFLTRLSSFCRLILLDHRGFGLSDRVDSLSFEDSIEDARAVLDAIGSERAVYAGCDTSGRRAIMFAATHPDRCSGVVLFGAHPTTFLDEPDYPWGASREEFERIFKLMDETWAESNMISDFIGRVTPTAANDPVTVNWFNRLTRSTSRKQAMTNLRTVVTVDVRPLLGLVRAPTLVLHRTGDVGFSIEASRYMAERIPGAKFVELPGQDHLPYFDHPDELIDEIRNFLTGTRADIEPDRVVTTILFSDIVASTETASRVGDRRWRDMLDAHDAVVRKQLGDFRGRLVKHTGDGFLASFDGPARAIRCALAIRDAVHAIGIETRSGLHTGEVELRGEDVGGIAVHIGARVSAEAEAGEVWVSRTVTDLVAGSNIAFSDHGQHTLKGVPGEWSLFSVDS